MCFGIRIHNHKRDGRRHFSILVARIDLAHSLFAMLSERTGMGKTGETLIVNKDTIALNELRWHDHAPMRLKINAKPAILASEGAAGIIETSDYRKEKVLASYTYMPKTRWGFVAKQDLSEIYAPIRKMMINIWIILLISGLSAYVLALMLAMNFSKPILEITKVANQMQTGDFKVRCPFQKDDEYGVLARTLNNMAESMEIYRE